MCYVAVLAECGGVVMCAMWLCSTAGCEECGNVCYVAVLAGCGAVVMCGNLCYLAVLAGCGRSALQERRGARSDLQG